LRNNIIDLLIDKLTSEELQLVPRSYDIVGDIAVIRFPDGIQHKRHVIAEALMKVHKNVKTVMEQVSPVEGKLRLRKLEHILGEKKTWTRYREFGCIFEVDLSQVFFSPRLSYERMRIAELVNNDEVCVNMFAGVGSYSVILAKHSAVKRCYSIDVNPEAVRLMSRNIWLNRVEEKVVAILGDAKEVIRKELQNVADRVLMPLPEKAFYYLDVAVSALKTSGGIIHYYDFTHETKSKESFLEIKNKVSSKLSELNVNQKIICSRIVRSIGPRWYQIALDIKIK